MMKRTVKFFLVFLVMGGAASALYFNENAINLEDVAISAGFKEEKNPQDVRYDVDLSKKNELFEKAPKKERKIPTR